MSHAFKDVKIYSFKIFKLSYADDIHTHSTNSNNYFENRKEKNSRQI